MSLRLRENILRLMKERRLSQTQLAKEARIAASTLHGYLNPSISKQAKIDVLIIKRIAEALSTDFHELLFGVPDPNSKTKISEEILHKLFEGDLRVTIHKIDKKK